ncbi:MAG: hypothetical protein KDA58_03585 [Planctomycetaceae bacterium]|nr:hypothetical protein [Planctomycetaceae bacterium]
MKVHQFLDHYGITENPFAQEDAASDRVFQEHCLEGTHHPAWDKVFGDPETPSTAVVFGEQGSGKTALRLQIVNRLRAHNEKHPDQRVLILEYDDFNPFLDTFRERLSGRQRKPENALKNWRLWDHMDAILSLATTRLANTIRQNGTDPGEPSAGVTSTQLEQLTRPQKRDLLLLAGIYDNNRELSLPSRWSLLKRKLRFSSWSTWKTLLIGLLVTACVIGGVSYFQGWKSLLQWWVAGAIVAGWLPYLIRVARMHWLAWRIARQVRILDHAPGELRRLLLQIDRSELSGQPLPSRARGDDRYEMLMKLQSILKTLGFGSIVVLVDRVDEPHLINGSAERIRDLLWPIFDNKFLKHPGIAFKLLLPASVVPYLNRQEKEFYERSRLDKQNLVQSLSWTGQALYDVANDRIKACTKLADKPPTLSDLFSPTISQGELIGALDRLRAPRHLFKFLYRLLVDHCSKYTEDKPEWKIQPETLQVSMTVFQRELQNYDQKLGAG